MHLRRKKVPLVNTINIVFLLHESIFLAIFPIFSIYILLLKKYILVICVEKLTIEIHQNVNIIYFGRILLKKNFGFIL